MAPPFLVEVATSPETYTIGGIAMACLGFAGFVVKTLLTVIQDAQKERAEEREVRTQEANAQKALLDAFKAATRGRE